MDSDDKLLMFQRAAFGKQVQEFFKSDIGHYILERAAAQIEAAHLEFRAVDCTDASKVRAIQNKIAIAESIIKWLGDAVTDGLKALEILEDRSE